MTFLIPDMDFRSVTSGTVTNTGRELLAYDIPITRSSRTTR